MQKPQPRGEVGIVLLLPELGAMRLSGDPGEVPECLEDLGRVSWSERNQEHSLTVDGRLDFWQVAEYIARANDQPLDEVRVWMLSQLLEGPGVGHTTLAEVLRSRVT